MKFISLSPNVVQRWYSAKCYIRGSQSWKTKSSKRTFHPKVKKLKPKFTLIQDYVNRLSNNRAWRQTFVVIIVPFNFTVPTSHSTRYCSQFCFHSFPSPFLPGDVFNIIVRRFGALYNFVECYRVGPRLRRLSQQWIAFKGCWAV